MNNQTLSWQEVLADIKKSDSFQDVLDFVSREKKSGKVIYPVSGDIFNAFALTPFSEVRVVILGQDPYHGPAQAHGLSFSVPQGVRIPPSLQNIFKEIERDLGIKAPVHGTLETWARQGVFLLNAVLTVEEGKPSSHAGKGWEEFTDAVIQSLSDKKEGVIFLLWGAYAHKKIPLIDTLRHTIFTAVHPSPLSAHRGFLGCGHFSKVNEILVSQGQAPIDWSIT